MALFEFNSDEHKPDSMDPVPPGEYPAMIIDSRIDPTKSGKGKTLKLLWQIIDGHFKGRKIFQNLTIQHENLQTQDIALKQLSSICIALGVTKISETGSLHNQPLLLTVDVRAAQGQYNAQNDVKKIKPLGSVGLTPGWDSKTPEANGSRVAAQTTEQNTERAPWD